MMSISLNMMRLLARAQVACNFYVDCCILVTALRPSLRVLLYAKRTRSRKPSLCTWCCFHPCVIWLSGNVICCFVTVRYSFLPAAVLPVSCLLICPPVIAAHSKPERSTLSVAATDATTNSSINCVIIYDCKVIQSHFIGCVWWL